MLLLIVLVLLGDQTSKVPYQESFARYESLEAKDNSRSLNDTLSILAQGVPNGGHYDIPNNKQADSADHSEKRSMLTLTFWIVIINAAYVIAALLQWRAIKYQVRMSHRAQLAASPDGIFDLIEGNTPRVQLKLRNIGGTTAYDCRYETWQEVLPFPFVDFSTHADHVPSTEPCALYPKHDALTINIPIRPGLSIEDRHDILALRRFLCIRLFVTYKDTFHWRRRRASFAFYAQKEGLAFLPKYNDAN